MMLRRFLMSLSSMLMLCATAGAAEETPAGGSDENSDAATVQTNVTETAPSSPPETVLPDRLRYKDKLDWHMVAIEALVVEVDEERARQLGFTYGITTADPGDGGNIGLGATGFSPVPVATLIEQAEGVTDVGFVDRMPGLGLSLVGMDIDSAVVSAQLRALVDNGEAVVRTRPVGVALNKTEVNIETVDELPYVDVNAQGKLSVSKKTVGVKLQVLPTIVPDYPGAVQLDITNIEISSGSRFMTLQNVDRPVISLSRTHTKITLREGETFVVGGLKTRRTMVQEDKVPILGDIPFIKWLFTSRREVVRNMDVLFFITPSILEPGENFLLPYDFENREFLGANLPKLDR